MAAQASITLDTHVYAPAGVSGGIATWMNREGDFPLGFSKLTESVRGPSSDGSYRVLFKLDVPKVATEDSSCNCAGSLLSNAVATVDVKIPGNFDSTDRTTLYLRLKQLVEDAVMVAAIETLTPAW
jgi:hypothetical protein